MGIPINSILLYAHWMHDGICLLIYIHQFTTWVYKHEFTIYIHIAWYSWYMVMLYDHGIWLMSNFPHLKSYVLFTQSMNDILSWMHAQLYCLLLDIQTFTQVNSPKPNEWNWTHSWMAAKLNWVYRRWVLQWHNIANILSFALCIFCFTRADGEFSFICVQTTNCVSIVA